MLAEVRESIPEAVAGKPVGTGLIVVAGHSDYQQSPNRPVVLLEHGAGQSYRLPNGEPDLHPSNPGGRHRERAVLFLCTNESVAERNLARYPGAKVAVIGSPRLESLVESRQARAVTLVNQPPRVGHQGRTPVIALSFHWANPQSNIPEAGTAWPHYRDVLPELARRFQVIGHGHPRAMRSLVPWYEAHGIEVVPDFAEVIARAEVFACDNSSAIFEAAACGIPVVLLNCPAYRREVEHSLRFWELSSVGVQCDEPAELVGAIREALQDSPARAQNRQRAVAQVYPVRTGGAAIAVAAILEALEGVLSDEYEAAPHRRRGADRHRGSVR